MSSRIVKFLIVLLLVALTCYLFYLNPDPVSVTYAKGKSIEWPMAIILISTFFLGSLAVGLLAVLIGARHAMRDWMRNKRDKQLESHKSYLLGAREKLAIGNLSEAKTMLKRITDQDPSNVVAWLSLANVFERENDSLGAIKVLDRARLTCPENLELLFRAADLNEKLGNHTAAYDNLTLVLNSHPGNLSALGRLVDYCRALGRYEDAIKLTKELMRRTTDTEHRQHAANLAALELEKCKSEFSDNAAKLRSAIEDIIKRHRDFAPALSAIAELDAESGDLTSATKLWSKAYKASHDLRYLKEIAKAWLDADQPSNAVSSVRSAVESARSKKERDIRGGLFLAGLMYHLEMIDDASKTVEQLSTMPNLPAELHGPMAILRARLAERKGDANQAFSTLIDWVEKEGPIGEEITYAIGQPVNGRVAIE